MPPSRLASNAGQGAVMFGNEYCIYTTALQLKKYINLDKIDLVDKPQNHVTAAQRKQLRRKNKQTTTGDFFNSYTVIKQFL